MPHDQSSRPEDADSSSAHPTIEAPQNDGGRPHDEILAMGEEERAPEQRTQAVVVFAVAFGMLLALALPIAAGFLAYYLLADVTDGAMLRLLLSITAGLITMITCNFLIVLPLGAFAGSALQRYETTLHDDESALLHELRAHDEARYADPSPSKGEGLGATRTPADDASPEPPKIDDGSDAPS